MLEPKSGDRYELLGELGSGGMGVVYRARDHERGTMVALKTLQRASATAIARFKREFRGLADVIHPNLVALYELVVDGERLFYTMELVDGVHFDAWVRPREDGEDAPSTETATESTRVLGEQTERTRAPVLPSRPVGELDVRRLRVALRQLAEGVAAIHEAGMLHRDLKPSNVMVTPAGRVVLLDFGLVTAVDVESFLPPEQRPLEGTAMYMSPEQGARLRLGPASDWYSMGVMLYLALTGRRPFVGGRDDVLMDKQRFEPPPPHEIAAGVPEDLSALCVDLLRRDPARRPAVAEVLRRLGSDARYARPQTVTFSSGPGEQHALVGRERELHFLEEAWRSAREGHAVVAHLRGPSGMGKTRLLGAFLEQMDRFPSVLVLRGRCYERESMPFKAVDSSIDELARYLVELEPLDVEGLMPRDAAALARVFPALRQVDALTSRRRRSLVAADPQELRRSAFAALRELFTRLSDRTPVVLAIDDAQWGDTDSADLLASLVRGADAPPILLLICAREAGGADAFRARLTEELRGSTVDQRALDVDRLNARAARELARLHLGDRADDAEAARIADESQGNPFFVEELARHVREARPGAGVSLHEALRSRLVALPDPAARLLSVIAVAARPIAQMVAMRAAGVADPSMLSLLKAGSFIQPRSISGVRSVEAYHDRIRDSAVSLLDEVEVRDIHARLARLIEAGPHPDPEALVTHFAGAGEHTHAAEHALAAARRAMESLAFDRAAELYRIALELAPEIAGREARIALGDALTNVGRGAEAAAAYESAISGASTAEALDLRCRAAKQLLYSGHVAEGLSRLEDIIGSVGMRLATSPRRAVAALVWSRLRLSLRGLRFREREAREVPASQLMRIDAAFAVAEGLAVSDTIRGADFHNRSVLLALKCGELERVHRAVASEAVFLSLAGVPNRRHVEQIRVRLAELTERLGTPQARAIAIGIRGIAAFNFGAWQACLDDCRKGEEILREECVGMRFEIGTAQLYQGYAMALAGRVREMVRGYPRLVTEAHDRGDLFLSTSMRAALGVYLPLLRDDPDAAMAEVNDAMAHWPQEGFHLPHCNALAARVYIDMYRGDDVGAYRRCEEEWPALERSRLLWVQLLRVMSWAARGRAALGAYVVAREPAMLRCVRKSIRVLKKQKVDYARAMAHAIEAGLAVIDGDDERALARFADSERVSDDAGLGLHAAAARWSRGQLLGGDEGAALRDAALDMIRDEGLAQPERLARIFAPVVSRAG